MLQAAVRASIHLDLFDNLRPVLHPDAIARAMRLIHGVAHAQTTESTRPFLGRSRNTGQRQRGKQDSEHGELRALLHRGHRSIHQPDQGADSMHLVTFSAFSPDNAGNLGVHSLSNCGLM